MLHSVNEGWIKLYRKIKDNPVVMRSAEHLGVWIYLLMEATHKKYDVLFNKKRITLKPGQLITGRKSISGKLKLNENKVQRILKTFENEHQIEQQTTNINRLITINNWGEYQGSEQQFEQRMNNKRTTGEQRVNTNNNINNIKNDKKVIPPSLENIKLRCIEVSIPELEAEKFFDFYNSNGWKVGKNSMKDWHSALSNWKRNIKEWGKNNFSDKPTEFIDRKNFIDYNKATEILKNIDLTDLKNKLNGSSAKTYEDLRSWEAGEIESVTEKLIKSENIQKNSNNTGLINFAIFEKLKIVK